jgi:hypothetical protein
MKLSFFIVCSLLYQSDCQADAQTINFENRNTPIATINNEQLRAERSCLFFSCSAQNKENPEKKVFAHYFTPYPISLDNKDPSSDYYAKNYLLPSGENGKFSFSGGLLKQRPLPRPVIQLPNWAEWDYQFEVKKASSIGIDGFAVDILSSEGVHWERVNKLLDATKRVNNGFRIMLMPDMEGQFKAQPEKLIGAIRHLAKHPSVYRLDDGRLVLSPYNAQNQSAAWWRNLVSDLKNEGVHLAMVPVFQGWQKYAKEYAGSSYAMSDWGVRSVSPNLGWNDTTAKARAFGTKWMMPVAPQDSRPKDLMYWEASNSSNYRTMWANAITGDADWVQIVTWNDYSESTEIAPSTETGTAFFDLTAFYVRWFKTNEQPKILRDAIYYFHRIHSVKSKPDTSKQPKLYTTFRGSDQPKDEIEFLAFLTMPALLEIKIGSNAYSKQATSGMVSFKVPLSAGRPEFSIFRDGRKTLALQSRHLIKHNVEYQDLLYRADGIIMPETK